MFAAPIWWPSSAIGDQSNAIDTSNRFLGNWISLEESLANPPPIEPLVVQSESMAFQQNSTTPVGAANPHPEPLLFDFASAEQELHTLVAPTQELLSGVDITHQDFTKHNGV